MQARYYDPVIGRFYSNDPLGFRGVHSFNRYAYANNNPYKYVDPDGNNPVAIGRFVTPPPIIQSTSSGVSQSTQPAYITSGGRNSERTDRFGNLVFNESADPVDGIKKGKSPAKGEAGDKGQLEGANGMDGALEDLGSIPLEEGSEWASPDGSRQGGTMSDGSVRKVNVHPSGGGDSYPEGTPTLEVQ